MLGNSNISDLHQRELDSSSHNGTFFIPVHEIAEMLQIPVDELPTEATVDTWLNLLDRKEQIAQRALLSDAQKEQIQLYGRLKGNSLLLDPNDFIELLETLVNARDGEECDDDSEEQGQHDHEEDDDDGDGEDEHNNEEDHYFRPRQQNGRVMVNGNGDNVDHYDDAAIETYGNGNNHHIDRYPSNEQHDEDDDGNYGDEDEGNHADDGVNDDDDDNSIDKEALAHYQQQRQKVYHEDLLQPPADSPVSQFMDARPRTSKLLNFTAPRFQKTRRVGHTDDSDAETGGTRGGSPNHPSVSPVSIVGIHDDYDHHHRDLTRSGGTQSRFYSSPRPHHHHLRDNTLDALDIDNIRPMASVSESLHSQHHHHHNSNNSVAQRRLQETERRLEKISQEYDEQIAKLEIDLSTMRHEIVMHKKTIAEYQTQEHSRLEHISDLETQIEEYGSKHTKMRQASEQLKSRLEERNEEVARLQESLQNAAVKLKQAEANFEQLYLEYSAHKTAREKTAELQMHLDQELEGKQTLIMELEEKTRENSRMKHIIDDMKTDLDEARRRAAQIVVPVKTLGDELGESSSVTGQDTKEVQTEQPPSSSSNVGDKEKLDSLRVVLARTEQQLETAEERLDLSERRVKELEDKLADMEQDLMRVKRHRDDLQKENTRLFKELHDIENEVEASINRPTASKAVQSQAVELCETCGYIAAEHEHSIRDLTQRVQEQAETIRRVRAMGSRRDGLQVSEYISMAHNTLFRETTATARAWQTVVFILATYAIVQLFFFIKNTLTTVSYGLEDYPYVGLYPLPVGPYTSRSKFVEEIVFWLQSLLLDEEDFFVPT